LDTDGAVINPPPGGVLLSERLAAFFDARPGDIVEVQFLGGRRETHPVMVSGTVEQYFGLGAYMDFEDLNRLLRQSPRVSTVNVTLDSADRDTLHLALKDLPKLTSLMEMDRNRQAFQDTIRENIAVLNTTYVAIAVLITVGVAYNAARIQLSERARELASLRILGYARSEVSYILVGEIMLLALLAQPIGWAIGAMIARAMTETFTSDLYAIPLVLRPGTFARGSLVVLVVAFAAAMIVRRRLDHLDLVAVMKTRE
jgi:putative ABC transport system permease protein